MVDENKKNTYQNKKINAWTQNLREKYEDYDKYTSNPNSILNIKPVIKPKMSHIVEYGEKINLIEIFAKFETNYFKEV